MANQGSCNYLACLLMQLFPKCTQKHVITYTNFAPWKLPSILWSLPITHPKNGGDQREEVDKLNNTIYTLITIRIQSNLYIMDTVHYFFLLERFPLASNPDPWPLYCLKIRGPGTQRHVSLDRDFNCAWAGSQELWTRPLCHHQLKAKRVAVV